MKSNQWQKSTILPMTIDVEAVVRFIFKSQPIPAEPSESQRRAIALNVLDYFAPEDRAAVAPIVESVLAELVKAKAEIEAILAASEES